MPPIRYRSIEDVKQTLENAQLHGRGCTLLIGAGCSSHADIPTAAGFVEIIKQRYPFHYQRALVKTYPKCMAELLLTERHDLIAEFVDNAKINWAHLCIALLMQAGYVDRVLTTNFDLLVVRACAMLGVFPAAYDFAASQLLNTADIPDKAVFYLHGQRTGFVLMNTEEDMDKHCKLLAPVFEEAGRGHVWIVVGYSGENDPVFSHLTKFSRFESGLYWIGYEDQEPPDHVREELLGQNKDAFFIKGFNADSFFIRLTQDLKLFPPDLIAKPFTYLRCALSNITQKSEFCQDIEQNWMRESYYLIDKAIENYEGPISEFVNRENIRPMEDKERSVFLITAARYRFMQGQYEQVISYQRNYDELPSEELADVLSMAYVKYGNQLLDQAKEKSGSEADQFFNQAMENYEAALKINTTRHEALHNWGNLLLDKAKRKTGKEAEQLFTESRKKFEAAIEIKPNQPEILINFGNLLLDWAKASEMETGDKVDQLFREAAGKYEAAASIKPNMPDVLYSWGNLFLDWAKAKAKTGEGADQLFHEAEGKYKLALAIRPYMHGALYQLGNVFLDRAKMNRGKEEADQLFKAAERKYQQALDVKPDMWEALVGWGNLMLDQAKTKTGPEAEQLFDQADKKYSTALDIKPDEYAILDNWGNAISDRARSETETGKDADKLFAKAEKKYEAALAIRPGTPDVLNNRRNLLLDWAKTKTGEVAEQLRAKAEEDNRTDEA
ncbi:MAG: SIR2 family protein [Thermodesulfobacteriota bacterium]